MIVTDRGRITLENTLNQTYQNQKTRNQNGQAHSLFRYNNARSYPKQHSQRQFDGKNTARVFALHSVHPIYHL
jgi:hypothetical protein